MNYELINLDTVENPKNINLGTWCSPSERKAYISLFKQYMDLFDWSYGDFKTWHQNYKTCHFPKGRCHTIPTKAEESAFNVRTTNPEEVEAIRCLDYF